MRVARVDDNREDAHLRASARIPISPNTMKTDKPYNKDANTIGVGPSTGVAAFEAPSLSGLRLRPMEATQSARCAIREVSKWSSGASSWSVAARKGGSGPSFQLAIELSAQLRERVNALPRRRPIGTRRSTRVRVVHGVVQLEERAETLVSPFRRSGLTLR